MIDYDEVFSDDLGKKFFYTNYPGNKMMEGKISLENAIARLNVGEYYTFVTYREGDELPKQYTPLNGLTSEDGTLFATVNPNVTRMDYICRNGGIQMISRLSDTDLGSPNYLLGPGPDTIALSDIVSKQYESYQSAQTNLNQPAKK